ncbi:MAG: YHS domain-containing protein [Actinobacteria bacterium]|nr:YHS domain-containing protein [Actinomycetota bacterium]
MATDPVCGIEVDPEHAAASAVYRGKTYYFCAGGCSETFVKEPEKYVTAKEEGFLKHAFRPR